MPPTTRKAKATYYPQLENSKSPSPPTFDERFKTAFVDLGPTEESTKLVKSDSDSDYRYNYRKSKSKSKSKGRSKTKRLRRSIAEADPSSDVSELSDLKIDETDDDDHGIFLRKTKSYKHPNLTRTKSLTPAALSTAHSKLDDKAALDQAMKELLNVTRKVQAISARLSTTDHTATDAEYTPTDMGTEITTTTKTQDHRQLDQTFRSDPTKVSFMDLPPELRTKIYRQVLVEHAAINFDKRLNLCLTSALLRTNHAIYEEARRILYGENAFHFARVHACRGAYYQEAWREIGYKDFRRFLEDIGPRNMACLQYVSITMEDAKPQLTPGLRSSERQYLHDQILFHCFRLLAKHTTLARLTIRRWHQHRQKADWDNEYYLLRVMGRIRVYELRYGQQLRGNWSSTHMHPSEWPKFAGLRELMEIPQSEEARDERAKKKPRWEEMRGYDA